MFDKRLSFSNLLIFVSIIVTIISFLLPNILIYGLNRFFLLQEDYVGLLIQFFLYQFLHGGTLHVLSNSIFLYMFGNQIESLIGKTKYVLFFLINTVFVGTSLLILSDGNTIGISGFAMAVLAYMFLDLRSRNNPEYRSAGIFLLINIAIGFTGNISLVGHLMGAICGL